MPTTPDQAATSGFLHSEAPLTVERTDLTVGFDARPLHPSTRHWGVGVVIDNVIGRLRQHIDFVGFSPHFPGAKQEGFHTWPSIPNGNWLMFEATMLLGIRADVYWGTNDFLPQYTRMPSIVTIHDLLLIHYPGDQFRTRFLSNRMISSVKRATKIAADSETTANDLIAVCPEVKSKIEVIHLGYRDRNDGRQLRAVDQEDDKYVLMLGAHRPRKNLTLAVDAVAKAREKGINIRLVVTGDVHACFSEDMMRSAAFVEQTGVLSPEALSRRLQCAVALLFPSKYEGFGFPMLEAMAAGCPVIALDTPINREISGNGGLLLDNNPSEWGNAIESLTQYGSLRNEMRDRGFENIQRFSWHRTAAMYAQLFEQLGANRKPLSHKVGAAG